MASFLVDTANVSVVGTPGNDQFVIVSGAEAATVQGAPGADNLGFDFTNTTGYAYVGGRANGNEGDDTVSFKIGTGGKVLGNYFGGGKDNDSMAFTALSAAQSFFGNTIHGGMGDDTILYSADGANMAGGNTINGNEGNDSIIVSASATAGGVQNLFVGGGQGEDIVRVSITSDSSDGITVNGGLGSDRVWLSLDDSATNIAINGGTFGTTDSPDGDDSINLSAEDEVSNATIAGNVGNDTINVHIDETAHSLRVGGNDGDDLIFLSADGIDRTTVGGGQGNDTLQIDATASGGTQNSIIGGQGDDMVVFSGGGAFSANNTVTVIGGAGADMFTNGTSNSISGGNFGYESLSDSTQGTLDTIHVGTAGGGGSFMLSMPQSVDAFNGNANGLIFTGGVLDHASGLGSGDLSLSFILTRLEGALAEGDAVAFRTTTAAAPTGSSTIGGYVFVKGDASDSFLLGFSDVTGDAFSAGDASLANAGSTTLDLTII